MLTAGYEPWRRVDAAAISIIEIIIMLTSFLSGGRAERRGEEERRRRPRQRGDRLQSIDVIGIMGWFSGGSDAFDAVQNETGAKFTSVCFLANLKPTFVSGLIWCK